MEMKMRAMQAMVCVGVLMAAAGAWGQRLPEGVTPEHYGLHLTPDLKAATFAGVETIDVQIARPTASITLNAAEIAIESVTVEQRLAGSVARAASEVQTGKVSYDEKQQQATLTFPAELKAGAARLEIHYTGKLNNELRGFYLSKTAKRSYAVTQFESTDARRAFPGWDEPARKATFDIALTIDAGDVAISNMPVLTDAAAGEGKHTVSFQTTPKMSTYLVAFLVGDFQCIAGGAEDVPIRVCATPDKVQYGKLALDAAEHTLKYYDKYFGIKYPLPKLDLIGLADFEAGAMENFGAITFREADMLVDEATAPVETKKRVAVVVTHEMAHQWFGDMVTMQWWDNLWLNEGFATWMENKAANDYKPEWKYGEDVAQTLDSTLNVDALQTTRTIRAKADTPDEINEAFDGIAYGKAGAVLGMVEHWVGEETFRQGVHNYLAAHMYGNATAEDFWTAETAASKRPVDKVMESFVTEAGVPLLSFSAADGRNGREVTVAQSRFFLSPTFTGERKQSWELPVCFKTAEGPACELAEGATSTLRLPKNAAFLYGNADSKGYYRSAYTKEELKAVVAHTATLTAEERLGLLGDVWSLMRSGQGSVGGFLDLAAALHTDADVSVQESLQRKIGTVKTRIASTEDRTKLDAWLRAEYQPVYDKLPATGGTMEQRQLRGLLFGLLGEAGDEEVVGAARKLAEKYVSAPASVDAELGGEAVRLAAVHGSATLYDKLQQVAETSTDPEVQQTALLSLGEFRDAKLVERTLDYLSAGKVKNQDSWVLYYELLAEPATREQAWKYVREHWPQTKAQLTTFSGERMVGVTGSFCTEAQRGEMEDFWRANPLPATERMLKQSVDSINDCIHLHAAQEPELKLWLEHNRAE